MKLSIIMPYYETYELTEKLLEVLEPQLTDEVEALLTDDGCHENRLDKFKKIKITHLEENKGQTYARNIAIESAKGEYLAFIDTDDMIAPDYVETLLNAIKTYNTDVINFDWIDMTTNQRYKRPTNPALWKSIIKKEKNPKLEKIDEFGGEDLPYTNELLDKIGKGELSITYLDKVLYYYNSNREGSLTWKLLHRGD